MAVSIFFLVLTLVLRWWINTWLVGNIYMPINTVTLSEASTIALFVVLSLAVGFTLPFGFLLFFLQIFYFGALAMTIASVNQPQLFVTLIVWFCLLVGLSLDWFMQNLAEKFRPRLQLIAVLILIAIFLPIVRQQKHYLQVQWYWFLRERQYLQWAGSIIPETGYILGGFDDNLVWLSWYTQRSIMFNALYVASIVRPQTKHTDIQMQNNFSDLVATNVLSTTQSNLYILDENDGAWRKYLEFGSSTNYPAGKYTLKPFALNPTLDREVFQLVLSE